MITGHQTIPTYWYLHNIAANVKMDNVKRVSCFSGCVDFLPNPNIMTTNYLQTHLKQYVKLI